MTRPPEFAEPMLATATSPQRLSDGTSALVSRNLRRGDSTTTNAAMPATINGHMTAFAGGVATSRPGRASVSGAPAQSAVTSRDPALSK